LRRKTVAEETGGEPTEARTEYVPATGASGAHISEDDAAAARANQASAESLGVDQASFDKYYSKDAGAFNWQAYAKELEYKATQRGEEPESPKEPTQEAQPSENEGEAQDKVAEAGLNWDSLGAKIGENGTIDDADFQALADIGVPREIAENYIDMVKGQANQLINDVHTQFGGEEEFNRVYDGLENIPEDKLNAIDDLLRDSSTRAAGVAAAYAAAGLTPNGRPAPAATHQRGAQNAAPSSQSAQGFTSFEEQVSAMRDPRYYSDPAFRNEVIQRVAASTYDLNPRQHTSGL
jgi:hypothetical protein